MSSGEISQVEVSVENDSLQDSHSHKLVNSVVHLSLVEIVLGSFLHSLSVPFAGHFLSLNQGAFLCRALLDEVSRVRGAQTALEISVIASFMKALSPAGKKLGPMISISCQGALFSLGILCFGKRLAGQILSMVLLSLWAFIQPFVTYYIIYGSDLVGAIAYFIEKFEGQISGGGEMLWWIVTLIVATKCLLASVVPFFTRKMTQEQWRVLDQKIARMGSRLKLDQGEGSGKKISTVRGVWRDMTQPLFLMSLFMIPAYLWLTGKDVAIIFWYVLRVLSVAVIIFYLLRSPHLRFSAKWLAARSSYFHRLYSLALAGLRKMKLADQTKDRMMKGDEGKSSGISEENS